MVLLEQSTTGGRNEDRAAELFRNDFAKSQGASRGELSPASASRKSLTPRHRTSDSLLPFQMARPRSTTSNDDIGNSRSCTMRISTFPIRSMHGDTRGSSWNKICENGRYYRML